jgi:putative selenate reductase
MAKAEVPEGERCLNCNTICENCVDVCPNRANAAIRLPEGGVAILHVDRMCNECGNCTAFCPYSSEPCKDKLTLFQTPADFEDSANYGFLFLPDDRVRVRLFDGVSELVLADLDTLPSALCSLIRTVRDKYSYLYAETNI